MYQDSEHVLAAAYLTNLHTFAITLRTQASHASALEPEFARTAVAEMRRSFDEMQSHHQLLMKSMSDEESAKMVATMKQMHADHATIQDHLAVLEAEVEKDALDSKAILQHTSTILKSCKAMTGMQTAAVRQ